MGDLRVASTPALALLVSRGVPHTGTNMRLSDRAALKQAVARA